MRGRHVIVRERAPLVDDGYGNSVRDWAAASLLTIPNCSVQPAVGTEVTVNRDTVVSRWQLFAPEGTDLLPSDRVRHLGVVYEVDGDVQLWDGLGRYVYAVLQQVG